MQALAVALVVALPAEAERRRQEAGWISNGPSPPLTRFLSSGAGGLRDFVSSSAFGLPQALLQKPGCPAGWAGAGEPPISGPLERRILGKGTEDKMIQP